MPDLGPLAEFLAGAQVDPAVSALRPDYRALLITVDGLVPGPSDDAGDAPREDTTAALFILDALDPMTGEALEAAADDLVARLTERETGVRVARRLIAAPRPLL